jgi:hypothetical protein
VGSLLRSLKPKLSAGADGVPPFALRQLAPSLTAPLTDLFLSIIASRIPPDQFLPTLVTPIFKRKFPATDPNNYRPVGVASVFARLFESLLNEQLLTFLESNGLISDRQFGFRCHRSTVGQLTECLDDWTTAIDSGDSVSCVYTDFKAAFNKPTFPKLFAQLECLGVGGQFMDILKNYVPFRSSCVKVGECRSNPFHLKSGAVQGSPLSTTLFLCYAQSLFSRLEKHGVKIASYADDCKFYSCDAKALQLAVDELSKWCSDWQMVLAPEKCRVLQLGPSPAPIILLDGVPIPRVGKEGIKDLGFLICPNLSFSLHVSSIVAKAKSKVDFIFRAIKSKNIDTLTLAFQTYVLPILESGSPVFNCIDTRDSRRLDSCQRYFTRRLFQRCGLKRISASERAEFLDLPSLSSRRLVADLCFIHARQSNRLVCNAIPLLQPTHQYPTSRHLKIVPQPNAGKLRRSFLTNRVAASWNQIPASVIKLKPKAFRAH